MADFVSQRRQEAQEFGRAHREALVAEWMLQTGTTTRPLLREIIDELIEDVLGARLREEILPLDRYAQTELVDGRFEVSINSRMEEMPRVRNIAGIRHAAKWHESVHVVRDFNSEVGRSELVVARLPGLEVEAPKLVVCRGPGQLLGREEKAREAFAEHAGTAAAICSEDLARCPAYHEFLRLQAKGGDLGRNGWRLLYETASFIGINGPLLAKFWAQQGMLKVNVSGRLIGQPALQPALRNAEQGGDD